MRFVRSLAILAALSVPAAAYADSVTDVTVPYNTTGLWANWSSVTFNGTQIAASGKSGNQGTGLTFGNWSGQFEQLDAATSTNNPSSPNSQTFSVDVALSSKSSVNSLMNLFYGTDGAAEAVVVFTNSNGDTATYTVVGGQTIRDFNQSDFSNGATFTNTDPTLGDVFTQNWWNNDGNGQRLDAQTFVLPTSWGGTNLTGISITNVSETAHDDVVLSALQVDVADTPEPSSIALLGTGLLGVAGFARRRFSR